ncbi:MAG: MlaD family protein [Cyanobacteriota bacterium]|nr:MlaD family protein [Cyanobacteriota bacterium]
MRSRTLREGSLGLFILGGIGLFSLVVVWLQGVNLGRRSYEFVVRFGDVLGVQTGSIVRYRGVVVGKVKAVEPGPAGVDVTVEIASPEFIIPRNVTIEANQAGLISEATVDITPTSDLTGESSSNLDPNLGDIAGPISSDCNSNLIICENDRLPGEMGISFAQLARASISFTRAFSNPEFVAKLTTLTENSANAAEGVTQLTEDLSVLTGVLEQELGILSDYAIATTDTFASTADQFGATANEISRLAVSVNSLVDTNRTSLVSTLDNITLLSQELLATTGNLTPLFDRAGQTLDRAGQTFDRAGESLAQVDRQLASFDTTAIVGNLEEVTDNAIVLSENAALASANLRQASEVVNDPTNLVLLEETLDSARATFQNVQKITSDLDDLTGDPAFREDIRRLVDGLSGLVSSTEQLEEQVRTAQTLAPLETSIERLEAATVPTESDPDPEVNLKKAPIAPRESQSVELDSSLKKALEREK